MNIYITYLLILILTIILFIIIKDKRKALNLTGILTISSSILLIIITYTIKTIISMNLRMINLSIITNFLFMKFLINSLILFTIGILEILISKFIYPKKILKE